MQKILSYVLVSAIVSSAMLAVYHFALPDRSQAAQPVATVPAAETFPRPALNYQVAEGSTAVPTDFHLAAETAMPAVVHIKSIKTASQVAYDPFYEFFGMRPRQDNGRQHVSSGSGVILSPEGYIVTNNHVIKDADELEVTLYDNRSYKAKVIGTDPSTDLGLIKIDAAEPLPVVTLANSDEVRVGSWVLAVGNPFSLASTATAGIVSAIGRDLQIIKDQMAIESFIQTDAAVNPGNSGGALVDLEGHLIGVNTAIASPTGTYAGYAFAVPANIVGKVVADLKAYGAVQRGFLGVTYAENLTGELARQKNLPFSEGVFLEGLADKGGAKKGGLQPGDVIVSIDGIKVRNNAKLLELVARNRPGDQIEVRFYRNGQYETRQVQLTDEYGNTFISAGTRNELLSDLGLELRDLSEAERQRIGVERGVLITRLNAGKIRSQTDLRAEFIILKINDRPVHNVGEVVSLLEKTEGKVTLSGFYPGYQRLFTYTFTM
ncbi:MAG: trypsin-like peptidase domain-containing protein [Bacteroidia bacterium]